MACDCREYPARTATDRKILRIALVLNAVMFIVGMIAGILAQSTSLIADSLDMLADALAYALGLFASNRGDRVKSMAATFSGGVLLILGIFVLFEVGRRAWYGSFPESTTMIVVAFISLVVNANVLRLLGRFRKGEAHLRATWIFTRADVIINCCVILSGILVALTHSRYPDLIVGFLVGLFVIKEACKILQDARKMRKN